MSERKAEKFAAQAKDAGWSVSESTDDMGTHYVIATRDNETITIGWRGDFYGGWFPDVKQYCYYRLANIRSVYITNAAMARRFLAAHADYRPKRMKRSGIGRSTARPASSAGASLEGLTSGEDRDILRSLYGRTIVWCNAITGEYIQDHVIKAHGKQRGNYNAAIYKITTSSSGVRTIHFVGPTGFRSVALDKIVQVL